jgi:hypothetical protein
MMKGSVLLPDEAANFVKNVEQIMQERWLSTIEVARLSNVDYSNLLTQLKNDARPSRKFVYNIAQGLHRSPEALLAPPAEREFSPAAQAFIAEARAKGYTLEETSKKTGISKAKLKLVINKGATNLKLSTEEIIRLQRFNGPNTNRPGFSLPILAPFAARDVNMVALIAQSQATLENQGEWFYKRIAVKRLMREQGLNINAYVERIGMSKRDFKIQILGERLGGTMATAPMPSQAHWERVLAALNVTEEMEKNLVLMGKYKLNSQQVMELRECEKIFKIKAQDALIRNEVARMTEDDLYRLYIAMKHEWSTTPQGAFTQSTLQKIVHRVSLTKLAIIASTALTAFFKSLPVAAAETLTEYTAKDFANRAEVAALQQKKVDALLYYAGSDIAKLAILIPKAVEAAIHAPFDVSVQSNLVQHLLNLPFHIVQSFIEAAGYSAAIVNDWKEMWRLTKELMQSEPHDLIQPDEMSREEAYEILQNLQQREYIDTAYAHHQPISINQQTENSHLSPSSDHSNFHQHTALIEATASIPTTNEIASNNHISGCNDRYQVTFQFNGHQRTLEVGLGLEINVGNENNQLVSTFCGNGHCVITMRNGPDAYAEIYASYQPLNDGNHANASHAIINSSNASSTTLNAAESTRHAVCLANHAGALQLSADNASIERMQNNLKELSKANPGSENKSLALTTSTSSTRQMLGNLNALKDNQQSLSRCLATNRCKDFSQFTNASRPTHYLNSAEEADRYLRFYSNYINMDFRERPKPVYSGFSMWGGKGDTAGKHCDSRFQNCQSSSSNDCQSNNSNTCKSTLF